MYRSEPVEKKPRNLSVEAFRCLLMFLIVLGHSLSFWCGSKGFAEWPFWCLVAGGVIIWHVDAFIAISGWYGIKFYFRKFIYLLSIVAFYGLFNEICACVLGSGNGFSWAWLYKRGGWFVPCYLALMLCSPVINAAVDAIAAHSKKVLLLSWSLMAFAFVASWSPFHLLTGINAIGFGHQTFLMMAFVYLTACCARKIFSEAISLKRLVFVALAYIIFVLIMALFSVELPLCRRLYRLLTGNHAPTVYVMSLALLMIFVWHVKVPAWLEKVVKFISPSMFGVYLFHSIIIRHNGTSAVLSDGFIQRITGSWVSIFVIAVAVFIISICVDLIRRACVSMIRPYFDRQLGGLDKWVVSRTGGFV